MAKAIKKPRKNGYKMPDPLPVGEIFTDLAKTQWRLGESIGKGGFGEIYAAQEVSKKSSAFPFVIKVEPHGNGPLFVEMHFYMKNAKQDTIDQFKQKYELKSLGMPTYCGSGSHEYNGTKYRFIVMERFGKTVDQIRADNNGSLPAPTAYQLAWQLTYTLQYIHELGYVHADIKGGNILMGATPSTKKQAFLLDFGLATKFSEAKIFKPNPKKAHDGTIEYLSCDAHLGVPTIRGDFEILGYNLIQWLGGKLPWESKLGDPKEVQQIKEDSMEDVTKFVKTVLKRPNEIIVKFFKYVNSLKFNEMPNYDKIRNLFSTDLVDSEIDVSGPLQSTEVKRRKGMNKSKESPKKKTDSNPVRQRKHKNEKENTNTDDEVMVDATEEEPAKKKTEVIKAKRGKPKNEIVVEEVMTDAMKDVLARKKERENNITFKRPKRGVPVVNYDETAPKSPKKR